MIILSYMFILILLILFMLLLILNLISKKSFNDREKSSPFECGFDPKSSARLSFSLNFFMIAMIFLIFDIEITLIFSFIINMNLSNFIMHLLIFSYFILILLLGLLHEWKQGALNWQY